MTNIWFASSFYILIGAVCFFMSHSLSLHWPWIALQSGSNAMWILDKGMTTERINRLLRALWTLLVEIYTCYFIALLCLLDIIVSCTAVIHTLSEWKCAGATLATSRQARDVHLMFI